MEAQTVQQQVPVYHVCQNCGGEGCAACSHLLILDGDIQLDPEWDEEIPSASPINGVIGIISGPFHSCDNKPVLRCSYCNEADGHLDTCVFSTVFGSVCPHCGKTDYDSPDGCHSPEVYSSSVGDWVCTK